MTIAATRTLGMLAQEQPGAARVLEEFGLDYCRDGDRGLGEACRTANVSLDQLLDALEAAEYSARLTAPTRDWESEPLAELVTHICMKHHKFTQQEILRLNTLFEKVCSVHGKNHPELHKMQHVFQGLGEELAVHLMKEEKILFPYIVRVEESVIQKEPLLPSPFGSMQNPVSMMEHEHAEALDALRVLEEFSTNFAAPADACVSYRALYQALREFETDLREHIRLENDILFPRAIAMERVRS